MNIYKTALGFYRETGIEPMRGRFTNITTSEQLESCCPLAACYFSKFPESRRNEAMAVFVYPKNNTYAAGWLNHVLDSLAKSLDMTEDEIVNFYRQYDYETLDMRTSDQLMQFIEERSK